MTASHLAAQRAGDAAANSARTSPLSPGAVLQGDGTVLSRRTITLGNGRQLTYTARAGFLPLRRDDAGSNGELLGEMFFTAYAVDVPAGSPPRPVTFVWGGGPGGSASLSNIGPRRLKPTEAYRTPPPPYEIVDNPDTWLDITDLVLIDEMGTGYSRVAKPEFSSLFFNREGDGEAFTEFIRIYMRRYDVGNAPIFLRGGSYGSVRGAMVSDIAQRRGIPVRGMVLTAVAFASEGDRPSIRVPSYTAAAFHHKKLPPDLMADRDKTLREAEAWAEGPYMTAIGRGNALPADERRALVQQFARYTGLSPELIDRNNLRISTSDFSNNLLRGEGKILGHYDARITEVSAPREFNPTTDPSLNARGNAMPGLMERLYLSRELGANADLLGPRVDGVFLGPFGGSWPPQRANAWPQSVTQSAEWMAVRWSANGGGSVREAFPSFARAMQSNPDLHVLFAVGRFDLVTPYGGMESIRAAVAPSARDRIRIVVTESGHSVTDSDVHEAARSFYRDIVAKPVLPSRR